MGKIYFYYLRDQIDKRPLVTVCLRQGEGSRFYRGVAICSPKDNPCKKTGRAIASGRCQQAIEHELPGDRIFRDEPHIVFKHVGHYFGFKYTNEPVLTPLELKLIKGEIK